MSNDTPRSVPPRLSDLVVIDVLPLESATSAPGEHFSRQHDLPYLKLAESIDELTQQAREQITSNHKLALVFSSSITQLWMLDGSLGKPLSVDFLAGKANHRRLFGGGKGQQIAKACGIKRYKPRIVDATAGLAGDAFVFASLGCETLMLERNCIVQQLLLSGMERAKLEAAHDMAEVINRLSLMPIDATEWLATQEPGTCDVVYLDPMFPSLPKKALVGREMRYFHFLMAAMDELETLDEQQLLTLARHVAGYRVVVKRAVKSPVLAGIAPTYQLVGKSTRFDIYVNRSLPGD